VRSRGLVVAIAVVLAVLAAVGVIVYTNQVRNNATSEGTTAVIVSTQDIPAGTQLNPLIDQGVFATVNVPNDAAVKDAVTSQSGLEGETTTAQIFANEQIPTSRLSSSGASNSLGIDQGHVGLGLSVDGASAVNGAVQVGDHIAIYATFTKGTPVTKSDLKQLLTPAQISKLFGAAGLTTGFAQSPVFLMPYDFTIALVPSVKVLSVQNPPVDTTSGRAQSGSSTFILDLTPTDAQNTVFGTEKATLYLGLLPPSNSNGYKVGGTIGVPIGSVTGVGGK
jgi:Flp pilus assembly protein CpaB